MWFFTRLRNIVQSKSIWVLHIYFCLCCVYEYTSGYLILFRKFCVDFSLTGTIFFGKMNLFYLRSNSKNALTEHSPRKLTCFQDKIGSTALCPEWLIISLIGVTYALVTRSSWFIDNDWFVCILFNVFLFGKISIQIFKNYDIRW